MLKLRKLEQCQRKVKQSISLQSLGYLNKCKICSWNAWALRWWCHTYSGFPETGLKTKSQRVCISEKVGLTEMQIGALRSWITTHKSTCCKENWVRSDWTIQPSKILKERNAGVWAAKWDRIVVLVHLASHFTTASNSLDEYEKTGWKKVICLPAPDGSGCYRMGTATTPRDQNHLQERTEHERNVFRGEREQTAHNM